MIERVAKAIHRADYKIDSASDAAWENDGEREIRFEQARAAIEAMEFATKDINKWHDIETAPTLERIIVAGWQKDSGNVGAYWWWYEDYTDEHGKPMDWPSALMWRKPPEVPQSPPNLIPPQKDRADE